MGEMASAKSRGTSAADAREDLSWGKYLGLPKKVQSPWSASAIAARPRMGVAGSVSEANWPPRRAASSWTVNCGTDREDYGVSFLGAGAVVLGASGLGAGAGAATGASLPLFLLRAVTTASVNSYVSRE